MNVEKLKIKSLNKKNFSDFLYLIEEMARYEGCNPPDKKAKIRLKKDGLGKNPKFEGYLGELGDKFVSYVIFFMTYSSYLARPTLYIEDIFVLEKHRNRGIGQKMFEFCLAEAKKRECGRMEWCVYNWNKEAIKFYEKNNAVRLDKTYYRIKREKIKRFRI